MGYALSQEGDIVKLFVQNIYWPQLQPIFKDDIVTVKKFVVWMEASFEKNQSNGATYYDVKLRKQTLPFGKITDRLVEQHPLKKYKLIDPDKLREHYQKRVSDDLSPAEIWSHHIKLYTNGIGWNASLVDAVIENSDFKIQAEWSLGAFCITFYKRGRLFSFLEKIPSDLKGADFEQLLKAAKERQSFASKKLRGDFKLAGNVNRMVYFLRYLKKQ